jgi:hypothetical protein
MCAACKRRGHPASNLQWLYFWRSIPGRWLMPIAIKLRGLAAMVEG